MEAALFHSRARSRSGDYLYLLWGLLCNDIRARPSEWAQFVVNWVCEDTIPEGLRMLSGKDAQVFLDIFEEIAARTQPGRRRFLRKSRYTLRCWRHILCCLKLYSLKCRLMADAVDDALQKMR